jgi:hypothetical protein
LTARVSTHIDIRAKELKLRELNNNLEKMGADRTAELSQKKEKLAEYGTA